MVRRMSAGSRRAVAVLGEHVELVPRLLGRAGDVQVGVPSDRAQRTLLAAAADQERGSPPEADWSSAG